MVFQSGKVDFIRQVNGFRTYSSGFKRPIQIKFYDYLSLSFLVSTDRDQPNSDLIRDLTQVSRVGWLAELVLEGGCWDTKGKRIDHTVEERGATTDTSVTEVSKHHIAQPETDFQLDAGR